MFPELKRILPGAAIVLFALFIVTPVCGALFQCGCDWPWNGLFAYCDSLRGIKPGCPWCEHPVLGLGSLIVPMAAGLASARLVRLRLGAEASGGVAAASVLAGILGVLAGLCALGALTFTISGYLLP